MARNQDSSNRKGKLIRGRKSFVERPSLLRGKGNGLKENLSSKTGVGVFRGKGKRTRKEPFRGTEKGKHGGQAGLAEEATKRENPVKKKIPPFCWEHVRDAGLGPPHQPEKRFKKREKVLRLGNRGPKTCA